eukprot:CAMPEP_0180215338 /NCGR_PEP_ID=MMETSP0987-20121128/15454_1 /TAXON_ID=697907 /ORGANISM="non described non described, Strain CCMP2293" /LENGTH=401 /DNA_ID=CAMNT_0022174013 /DNA_START=74 /DNA_END=1279 /DNA_ORIENTATION=+
MAAPSLRSRSLLCAALAALLVTATLARVAPSDRNDLLKDNRVWLESRSADLRVGNNVGNNTTWRSASTQTRGGHGRNDALGPQAEGAHIRSAGEQPAHFVTYAGNKYATLDGAQPESNAIECQNYFLPLPAGWQLATHDADSIEVTRSHPWGTHALVYADGGQRYTSNSDYGSQAGQEFEWYASSGQPTALGESVDQPGWYKVNACARRILIVSTTPTQTLPPWGQAGAYASCVLNLTWDDIIGSKKSGSGVPFQTGGLGDLTVVPRFEVWLCVEGHACGEDFCFVFDEEGNEFVPWGPNSQLRLFTPAPAATLDTSGATTTPTTSSGTRCQTPVREMVVGTRVVRGTDWRWGNQDGGAGTVGVITAGAGDQWVSVSWDSGGGNNYRIGNGGSYDLFFADC